MLRLVSHQVVDGELILNVEVANPDYFSETAGDFFNIKKVRSEVGRLIKNNNINFKSGAVKVLLHGALLSSLAIGGAMQSNEASKTEIVEPGASETINGQIEIELPAADAVSSGSTYDYKVMNLVLIAGHQGAGADPGAVYNNRLEAVYTHDLVNLITKEIISRQDLNINVILEPAALALAGEMNFLKGVNADYSLSVHFNAGGGSGSEIIVPYKFKDLTIADQIIQNFKKFNQPIRPTALYSRSSSGKTVRKSGVAVTNQRDYYGIIRTGSDVNIHSDILEVEFIDNEANMKFYETNKQKYVIAIADAIESYYRQNFTK